MKRITKERIHAERLDGRPGVVVLTIERFGTWFFGWLRWSESVQIEMRHADALNFVRSVESLAMLGFAAGEGRAKP